MGTAAVLLAGVHWTADPATIATAVVALVAAALGWVKSISTSRRVDAVWQAQIDSWRQLVTELRSDLTDARHRIEELTTELSRVKTENIGLRRGWHKMGEAGGE